MNLEKTYEKKFGKNKDVTSLGWGSVGSQEKRFEILLEIKGYSVNDSVLDLGCGYGDLSKYVKNYTGIDLRKNAIKIANKKYKKKFIHGQIDEIKNTFDWVFSSGIFCFKDDWENNFNITIKKMYDLSLKGIGFNLLFDYDQKYKDEEMKYVKIEEIIKFITNISPYFSIRHDYLMNDITIYIYKK